MTHIKTNREDNLSWCGEILTHEFYFKDAESAALNGVLGTKKLCLRCVDNIVYYLSKGIDNDEN